MSCSHNADPKITPDINLAVTSGPDFLGELIAKADDIHAQLSRLRPGDSWQIGLTAAIPMIIELTANEVANVLHFLNQHLSWHASR
jgi:hypothetical protein